MTLKGKRVLLTGAYGFLGRHVWDAFRRAHAVVSPVGRSHCDLRDLAAVRRLFRSRRPEIVIHLAATVGGIAANAAAPGRFFYDNMQMGLNVIEASRLAKVSKLVLVGTVCSYPSDCPTPFIEEHLWTGYPEPTNAPYGVAKLALFTMADAYRRQYGLNTVCLIPANLYGPGDNFSPDRSHVIPALIDKVARALRPGDADADVQVWGRGDATREFLYVQDAARAIVVATRRLSTSDPINIGTGEETTIRQLAYMISSALGFRGQFAFDFTAPEGQHARQLDVNRALDLMKWRAKIDLERGLRETISYYATCEASNPRTLRKRLSDTEYQHVR